MSCAAMCGLDTLHVLGEALPAGGRVARGVWYGRDIGEADAAVEVGLVGAVTALMLLVCVRLDVPGMDSPPGVYDLPPRTPVGAGIEWYYDRRGRRYQSPQY